MNPGIYRWMAGSALIVLLAGAGRDAPAQEFPVPPCAGNPHPAAGNVGELLNQTVWIDDPSIDSWSPPLCTEWQAGPTRALVAAAGRFRLAGDTAVLASRLAGISALTELIYWSSTRGRWRALFDEAVALSRPERDAERPDFVSEDLRPGAELDYWLREDNPTAGIIYRMTVRERTPDRLVFEIVNHTPMRAQLLIFRREIAAPGEFRQLYFLERERGDTWIFYGLVRMGRAGSLAGTSAANYRNRTEAYFRFLAGLDMDREPPAARQ